MKIELSAEDHAKVKYIELEIVNIIKREIQEEIRDIHIHNIVADEVEKQIGKPITKRMETAIKKHFNEDTIVFLDKQYGMYHIRIWGGDSGFVYDTRISFLLGYHSDPFLNLEEFERLNACYGSAAQERIALLEKKLESSWVEATAKQIIIFQEVKKALESLTGDGFKNPVYYRIRDKFNLPKE